METTTSVNIFYHVRFMKWWYEIEESNFNVGRDLDFNFCTFLGAEVQFG